MLSRYFARAAPQLIRQSRRTIVQSVEHIKQKEKLTVDPKRIYCIDPFCTVEEAAKKLTTLNISCLIVAKGNDVVGIMTERDIVKLLGNQGEDFNLKHPVAGFMTKAEDIFSFKYSEKTLQKVLTEMEKLNIRHIPTTKKDKIVGIISIRDANEQVIQLLNNENSELRFSLSF